MELTDLRDSLPANVAMLDDGSLRYTEKVPTPAGYEPDANDGLLFHPLWRDCGLRLWRIQTRPEGFEISAICREASCPHYNKIVRHNTCLHCKTEPAVAEIPPAVELPKIRRKKCGSCSSSVS